MIDAAFLDDAFLREQEGARLQRDITDQHVVLDQRDARGLGRARLIEQMNEGARGVVVDRVGAEHDDVAGRDGQAVGAGHHVVGIGNEQQIAALQIDAVRAADRDVVADEVQPVDGHVVAGRKRLEIHVGQHAAVRTGRFEGQVRIADGEHITGIPGRDPGNLAVVDVGLGGEQDADLARLHGERRRGLCGAAVAVGDFVDEGIRAVEVVVRCVGEGTVGVQDQRAVRRAADRRGVDRQRVAVDVACRSAAGRSDPTRP